MYDDGSGPALYARRPLHERRRCGGGLHREMGRRELVASRRRDERSRPCPDRARRRRRSGALRGRLLHERRRDARRIESRRWDGSSWSALGSGMAPRRSCMPSRCTTTAVDRRSTRAALRATGRHRPTGSRSGTASSWTALGSGVGGGEWGAGVNSLTVYDDGHGPALYVGGSFTNAGGASANRIAKWDGSSWSALGSGVDFEASITAVLALTVYDDGGGPVLCAGGNFVQVGGFDAKCVAKWDGIELVRARQRDERQGPRPWPCSTMAMVRRSHAGGSFTRAGVRVAYRNAKWDGAGWSVLGSGWDQSSPGARHLRRRQRSGALRGRREVGRREPDRSGRRPARRRRCTGRLRRRQRADALRGRRVPGFIKRWDGSSWSVPGGGVNSKVRALEVFDDGGGPALYAAGQFMSAGGVAASMIAKWNGTSWSALGQRAQQRCLRPDRRRRRRRPGALRRGHLLDRRRRER